VDASGSAAVPGAGRSVRRRRPSPYLILSALAVLGAVALTVRQPWGADFGLHAAVVGRLRDDLLHPANPMVEAVSPSPYFTPYPVVLAVFARLTGASAATMLSVAAPINLALLLYGLRRFVGLFTESRWAPVLALLFVPLLWGPAVPQWSGFPALRGLVLTLPYPSTLALALVLLGWVVIAEALTAPGRWRWGLAGLLGGLIVLIHPFTAVAGALGAVALAAGRLRRFGRAELTGMLLGVAVTALVVLAWPYFRIIDVLNSASELDAIHRPLYTEPIQRYGLAFLVGLPALALRLRRDRRDPLVMLFGIAGGVVLAGAVTGSYALGRLWPVLLLSLQVAAAVELARVAGHRPAPARPPARILAGIWAVTAAVACLVGLRAQYGNLLLVLPADQLASARKQAHDVTNLPDYAWVDRAVGRGAVVLTDDQPAGRALLAYEIRSVAPPWPDPLLADEAQRRADQAELIAAGTPGSRRRELLTRYGVTWILDNRGTYAWADPYAVQVVDPPGPARLIRLSRVDQQ
jgi:hypothetical protein